ncbi:serine hydrolase domain-containing protein [Ruegeria sediminis]|uniref:serine hydrolase domain-containing protein n=1 Tax=Ruegeria sediminis TaxID=2583820 RepID=UPI001C5591DC|nr:serine hydrolase domain-containing protein [Ruegeria sediminis]
MDPDSAYAAEGLLAPGGVLLVRTPDWTYFKAAGVADLQNAEPLDCNSPYQIGSATKMMTGTVVMQLQEAGLLSLDDPLSEHLPEIAARLPNGDRITLREIANHTAGLFNYTDNAPDGTPGIMEGGLSDPEMLKSSRGPADLVEFAIVHGEPVFDPGTEGKWAYSNTGYVLLGMIIEKLEGKPLADVFRERIFAPVGMDATFLWNDVPREDFGLPRAWFKAPFDIETTDWNMSQGWAAGGVISTAPDMAMFVEALAAGSLFEQAGTLAAMQEGVQAQFPILTYGTGLCGKPGDTIGHAGQTLGFESDTAFAPASKTTMVFWMNSANNIAAFGVPLVAEIVANHGR